MMVTVGGKAHTVQLCQHSGCSSPQGGQEQPVCPMLKANLKLVIQKQTEMSPATSSAVSSAKIFKC